MIKGRLRFSRAQCLIAALAAFSTWSPQASAQTTYTTTWASVDSHPIPEWFKRRKIRDLLPLGPLRRRGVWQRMVPAQHVSLRGRRVQSPRGYVR